MSDLYDWLAKTLKTTEPGTVIFSAVAFIFFAYLIWHLTSVLSGAKTDESKKSANRLVALIGALSGWVIGMAFSPLTGTEQAHFTEISQAVSAFLSGYVVSKLDRFLEAKLFPVDTTTVESWSRIGLFSAALLLASVTVFVNRTYAFKGTAQAGAEASVGVAVKAAPTGAELPSATKK